MHHDNTHLVIGGPFTKVNRYLAESDPIWRLKCVTMMAGCRKPELNVFPDQFNIHTDPDSAGEVFEYLMKHNIPTKIVPTECIKSSVFSLGEAETKEIVGKSKCLDRLVRGFVKDTNPRDFLWNNFDGITAVAHIWSDLYKWNPTKVNFFNRKDGAKNGEKCLSGIVPSKMRQPLLSVWPLTTVSAWKESERS